MRRNRSTQINEGKQLQKEREKNEYSEMESGYPGKCFVYGSYAHPTQMEPGGRWRSKDRLFTLGVVMMVAWIKCRQIFWFPYSNKIGSKRRQQNDNGTQRHDNV